jgi:hypothetical protein
MSDLSAICVTCGKPEARHSHVGDNCPSEAGLYLATTFRPEGAQCMACGAALRDSSLLWPTVCGYQNDSFGRCAACKAVKAIDDAKQWDVVLAELTAEGYAPEPDDSQYVN